MNTKTTIREDAIYSVRKALTKEMPNGIQQSCINCKHFSEPKELCLKFNQRPPARVIALSCGQPHYEDNDDIPF